MVKKSLSWFLAIIMAFTVFGGASLLNADKANATVGDSIGYYICVQETNHGDLYPVNHATMWADYQNYNGTTSAGEQSDLKIKDIAGNLDALIYSLVKVEFKAKAKPKSSDFGNDSDFTSCSMDELETNGYIKAFEVVTSPQISWEFGDNEPAAVKSVKNGKVTVDLKSAGVANLSANYIDYENESRPSVYDSVEIDIYEYVLADFLKFKKCLLKIGDEEEDDISDAIKYSVLDKDEEGASLVDIDLSGKSSGQTTVFPAMIKPDTDTTAVPLPNEDIHQDNIVLDYSKINGNKYISVKEDKFNYTVGSTPKTLKTFVITGKAATSEPQEFEIKLKASSNIYAIDFPVKVSVSAFDKDDLQVGQVNLNVLKLVELIADYVDSSGDFSTIVEEIEKIVGSGTGYPAYRETDEMSLHFMDLYEDGIETYASTNLLKLNDKFYAACVKNENGNLVPVTTGEVEWDDNENVEVVTLGELYGDYVKDYLYKILEIEEKDNHVWYDGRAVFDVLEGLGVYTEDDVKAMFAGMTNENISETDKSILDDVDDIEHIRLTKEMFKQYMAEAENALDSIAFVLGTNGVKNDTFGFDVEAGGTKVTKSIPYSVTEMGDPIKVEEAITGDNSVTIKWDAVPNLNNYFGDENDYWVYLEEVNSSQEPNDTYAFALRSIIAKIENIAEQIINIDDIGDWDTYNAWIGKQIDLGAVFSAGGDFGWKQFTTTEGTSMTFNNLEKGKEYRAVVIAFKGYGNEYASDLNSNTSIYDKAVAVKGEINFKAEKKAVDVKNINASLDKYETTFNGSEQKPAVTVTYGNAKLVQDTDYTVDFGTGDYTSAGKYTVTITGKGDYTGTRTLGYEIKAAELTDDNVALDKASVKLTDKEQKPSVKVTFGNAVLIQDTDYTVDYGTGDYKSAGEYTVTVKGKGNYAGTVTKKFIITKDGIDLSACTLVIETEYAYSGKIIKPEVTVLNGLETVDPSYYTVEYDTIKKVGTYKVTVTGNGKDAVNSLSENVVVKPQATKIKSLKKGSKRFTVQWTKRFNQVDGYQVQYARNSSFTSSKKTVKVSGYKNVKKTVKSLKAKKKYYVRVRTYKVGSDDKTYYSAWSDASSVKTK